MLKTDYRNDKLTGKRKWRITDNGDDTYTLDDATIYESEGDIFNADDINSTNAQVNKNEQDIAQNASNITGVNGKVDFNYASITGVKRAVFRAGGWSGSAPYSQTVSVSGMKEADAPVIDLDLSDLPASATKKVRKKAWACIDRGVTRNGQLILYCIDEKPTTDFTVLIKGV